MGSGSISLSVQRYLLTKATPALLPAGRPLGQGSPAELKAAYAAAPCLFCTPWAPLQLRPGQSFN